MSTNPAEFEITDKIVAVPALKDGLSVAVATQKDYYVKGERPAVTVTLTNTTDKPMTIHHPGHAVRVWTYSLTDLKNRTAWEARYAPGMNTLPPLKLAGGESSSMYVDFYDGDYQAADQPRPLKELPPGRYRMTIAIKLDNLPAAQFPNVWSGELKTNPVEFEIMAK
jgi:hypothetical protein